MQRQVKKLFYAALAIPLLYATWMGLLFVAGTAGYIPAQALIGSLFYRRWGVPTDYSRSVYWYRRASEQGAPEGDHQLATMYFNGLGVEQDYGQALLLFRRAAESGLVHSQVSLGKAIASIDGTSAIANAEAYKYLKLAAKNGHPEAPELLAQLLEKMTEQQILDGEKRLEEYSSQGAFDSRE